MIPFKLKSIFLDSPQELQVRETSDQEIVILRVADHHPIQDEMNLHHFRVPKHSTVDIRYETIDHNHLLRIIFQLEQRKLSIQYFTWDDMEEYFKESPLHPDITESIFFQKILQSINFSGENHISYIVNTPQHLSDLPK
ncbi:hypothetical protein ACNRWW_19475 [Metabacillus sp. HB246100]|uniref:hypothetical protein n=1 Tax=Bacillus weihaiensis TaxID=1547283 RepID=UPI002353F3A3|nr:hypothetical protein [Bacillus weihaiensis]